MTSKAVAPTLSDDAKLGPHPPLVLPTGRGNKVVRPSGDKPAKQNTARRPKSEKPLEPAKPETEPTSVPVAKPEPQAITITVVGDTGFSRARQRVEADGVRRSGFMTWKQVTSGIAQEITGDINFANIETVITDRNDIRPARKGERVSYHFSTHPNGIRQLVKLGFNIFSLANNHSMDYGVAGLKETLWHAEELKDDGLLAYAGLGHTQEEAGRPKTFRIKGKRFAFSAVGIVTLGNRRFKAGRHKPGQMAYHDEPHYREVVERLADSDTDYKIMSIHYGGNLRVHTDSSQRKKWRQYAVREKGIDLIIGHHPHVSQGVEIVDGKVIFYGLGNFLHQGMANMSRYGMCQDYGLLGRVHLLPDESGKPTVYAIEVVPVIDMHRRTRRMRKKKSHQRIHVLNYLARRLDNKKQNAVGVRFTPQPDGTGLYCLPKAKKVSGRIGSLCRNWNPAPAIPRSLRRRIVSNCRR